MPLILSDFLVMDYKQKMKKILCLSLVSIQIVQMSQVANQAGAYPSFCSMMWLEVFQEHNTMSPARGPFLEAPDNYRAC